MGVTLHRLTEVIDDPFGILAQSAPIRIAEAATTQDLLNASSLCMLSLVEEAIETLPDTHKKAGRSCLLDSLFPHDLEFQFL